MNTNNNIERNIQKLAMLKNSTPIIKPTANQVGVYLFILNLNNLEIL